MPLDVIDDETLPAIAITPGDRDYEQVRHTYAKAGAPALVLAAETPEDVRDAVQLAAERGMPLAVRSGGHGPSTNDGGIVLDLGHLRRVQVLDGAAVRVESGARWGEVARTLDRYDLALTSGDTGDVGVGGVATVGGVGLFARRQGLTIDRIKAVEVVLADGTLVRADDRRHQDLLWAVRGAGGGFGVVVAFEFEADPIEHVTAAELVYDMSDLAGLFRRWAELVEDSPRDVSSFLYVQPGLARALVVDAGAGREAVERFAGVAPVVERRVSVVRYHTLLETSRSPHQAQGAGLAATGGLLDHVTAESAGAMADLITSGAAIVVQLRSVGGQVNDVAPEATAYAHRSQNFSVVVAAPRSRASQLDPITRYTRGTYLNLEIRARRARPAPRLSAVDTGAPARDQAPLRPHGSLRPQPSPFNERRPRASGAFEFKPGVVG